MNKSIFRRGMSFVLALVMILSVFAGSIDSKAATNTVSLSGMGTHGSIKIGDKTKSGTWWKMKVGSKEAFCVNLGKTCHSGNTYSSENIHHWNQDSGGEKAPYYARIVRFYVLDAKRSKKGFVLSQALIWSVAEGNTSKSQLKNVIKQIQDKAGYYTNKTTDEMYEKIFEHEGAFEVDVTTWKKTGGSSSYQTLLTVDAEDVPQAFAPKSISKHMYYRQRVTVEKLDDLGNPLSGIKFRLDVDNYDGLYSFSSTGLDGSETGSADEDEDTEFSLEASTTTNGIVAFRMTYRLQNADDMYYFTDADLNAMSSSEKAAAKRYLTEDLELEEGIDFGPNMTKAEAEEMAQRELDEQYQAIDNAYTLTEVDASAQPGVLLDPTYANGVTFNLRAEDSWKKDGDVWPDSQLEHPSTYSLAYRTGVTNNQKKVTIEVEKLDGYSSDRAAHGDATLEGARFQLYADPSCTTKATVYDEDGTPKEADEYTISRGKLETDYLLTGINYYLRETQAPTGYLINDTVYTLSADGAGINVEHTRGASSTEVSDQPILGKVAIQKYYNEDEPAILNPESGAKFQVYLKSAGSYAAANATYERDELTTDGTGYAVSKDLYYGTYVVHQVDTGSVDTVKMPDFEVTINENGKTYFYPLRNPYFRAFLKVIKLDKNTGKTVLKPGTAYQIYKVDDAGKEEKVVQTYSNGNKTVDVDTFTTDATGEIMTVKELKSGKYRIYETDAASGLHITKKYIEVTINSKLNNYTEWLDAEGNKHVTVSVTYENEETKAKVTIKKTGEKLTSYDPMRKDFIYSDAPLNGAVFEIYADGDIVTQDNQGTTWYKNGELVTTVTTGVDAKFSREASDITGYTLNTDGSVEVSLPLGKYKVKEVKTPYGYVFPDTHEWNLEFNWKNANDPFVINSTSATDAAGTLNVKNSYAATKIELVKQDEYTKLPIKGAVFGLYTKTPIYNASGEKIVEADTEISTLTTDEEGRAVCLTKLPLMDENYPKSITTGQAVTVSGQTLGIQPSQQSVTLNSGDYYLKELDVSKSYYLDEERIPVHLEYKDAETKVIEASVEMTNVQTVTEISKTDIAGSEEIPGCELSITDKDGNTIISWVSGEPESMKISENAEQMGYNNLSAEVSDTGSLIIRGLLHDTEYTLTEVRPADGYVTADNIDFMVKGKVQTVELPPAPTTSSTDAVSGQAVSGTSAHVPGAEHTIVSVKNEEGVYEDMFDNKVVMIDEQTHILLIKSDAETGDGLAGAKFDILDAEGNVVTSVVSKKNGLAIDGVLAVNQTYTFHETSAPKGYKTAEDMTVTIKDTADTQEIEIEDEHIPDKPDVPQTGKESFPFILSLIGAGLILSGFFGARSQIRVKTKDKDK